MNLTLARHNDNGLRTYGDLIVGPANFKTIELPWIKAPSPWWRSIPCGVKGSSCVPTGQYELVPHRSSKHGRTFALRNPALWIYYTEAEIPKAQRGIARSFCLIHAANYADELAGCIAPGLKRGTNPARGDLVTNSQAAMARIRELVPWQPGHTLTITRL